MPVLAEGDRLSYRARKFLRRNVASATVVSLAILFLTAVIWVRAGVARRARQEQRVADQQRTIAEVRRRYAQGQKAAAEHARDRTTVQQTRAEQKAVEAEQQRSRWRASAAERRFGDLRSLVTTLLFDLHGGIHALAGSAAPRRLKAQQYLFSTMPPGPAARTAVRWRITRKPTNFARLSSHLFTPIFPRSVTWRSA